jgi:hypothetical protein
LKTFEVLKTSKVWPEICAILNAKANQFSKKIEGSALKIAEYMALLSENVNGFKSLSAS